MDVETITISRDFYDLLNEEVTKLDVIRQLLESIGEYGHVSSEFIKTLKIIANVENGG